ncbi:MAG: 16S rRNA (adenine(1518)-N(6)/adenine(1519)-N(6))-dimethyltransferase RsmA [Thermodesulfobacteriota bacterium]
MSAHKGRGQHFLADPNLAGKIVKLAGVGPDRTVLEIGPGLGALTGPLLESGARVLAVEIDLGLAKYLNEELAPRFPGRLTVITEDILKVSLEEAARPAGGRLTIVGNLPYLISTPILLKLIQSRRVVDGAVLMFQRELADRLLAGPGGKTYGRLSVLLGYWARTTRLLDLSPQAFHPRPKVGSTVLALAFKDSPQPELKSPQVFERVVAAGFGRRRKTLRNALLTVFPADRVDAALAEAGINPGRRAETLSAVEFVHLANAIAVDRPEGSSP